MRPEVLEFLHQNANLETGLIVLVLVAILLYQSVIIVGGDMLAVVERRWFGKKMPPGRVVAMSGEVGIMARTLGPGFHFLIPFLYTAQKTPFLKINANEVGIVEAIDGMPIPSGWIFAKVVGGHNSFQDGEAFLGNSGQKGPQIQILPPGNYRINPFLFNVKKVEATLIEQGKIGVITSMDGQPISPGRLLGQSVSGHSNFENGQAFLENGGQKGPQMDILHPGTYRINTDLFKVDIRNATVIPADKVGLVTALDGSPLPEGEFIAKSVSGHDDYQEAQAFLQAGGQRGPQFDVIHPGTYYINHLMFKVEPDDMLEVQRGEVAVIISNVGKEPTEEMKNKQIAGENEDLPGVKTAMELYVVPHGYRGIQQEVIGPGRSYLNRRAFIPHIINTTDQTLEWESRKGARFDNLKVISNDGFVLDVNIKVVFRIRPEQSPYMVAKVGSTENLILNVIYPMIESQFRNQAASISAMNFMLNREEEQDTAEMRIRSNLINYHVECVTVLICQVILPDELMLTQTRRIIAEQQKQMYAKQQEAEFARVDTEKTRATADQQKQLVKAEIDSQAAHEVKSSTITKAEGQARKIELVGQANADAYRKQSESLGQQAVTAIELLNKISSGNVRITPDILVSGENGSLLDALLAQMVQNGGTMRAPELPGSKDPGNQPIEETVARPDAQPAKQQAAEPPKQPPKQQAAQPPKQPPKQQAGQPPKQPPKQQAGQPPKQPPKQQAAQPPKQPAAQPAKAKSETS